MRGPETAKAPRKLPGPASARLVTQRTSPSRPPTLLPPKPSGRSFPGAWPADAHAQHTISGNETGTLSLNTVSSLPARDTPRGGRRSRTAMAASRAVPPVVSVSHNIPGSSRGPQTGGRRSQGCCPGDLNAPASCGPDAARSAEQATNALALATTEPVTAPPARGRRRPPHANRELSKPGTKQPAPRSLYAELAGVARPVYGTRHRQLGGWLVRDVGPTRAEPPPDLNSRQRGQQ